MTEQIPDTCKFDGRWWCIEHWDGDCSVVPSNESLGIITQMAHTANYSGRIDHFVVSHNQLFLLKVEVNLTEESRNALPKGTQREVVTRFENTYFYDKSGDVAEIQEHRFEYLVYHDLAVLYTGDLYLRYPCCDFWDQPDIADENDEDPMKEILSFDAGVLIDHYPAGPV